MEMTEVILNKLQQNIDLPSSITDKYFNKGIHLNDYGLALLRDGHISRGDMGCAIGQLFNYSYVPMNQTYINSQLLNLLPYNLATELNCLPLYELGDKLTLAISEPWDSAKLEKITYATGKTISPVFAFPDEILTYIDLYYKSLDFNLKSEEYNNILQQYNNTAAISPEELKKLLNEKTVIKIVDALIYMALRESASDIHIEAQKTFCAIRLRKDGELNEVIKLPLELHDALISRMKIMAGLDITVKRLPQDGKMTLAISEYHVDIRISTMPCHFGEKVVLRLLVIDGLLAKPNLKELGLTKEVLEQLQDALQKTNGMIFVTGPTGAGKTTTLYALIEEIKNRAINIVTIEEPVEYEINGINQVEVNTDIGRDFTTVLRSVLRQDPDVILIGEIRDLETAKIATTAALTGHTVLTTLHTSSAVQAITRLTDMGVQNFAVAPSIIGILNQRLVRKICQNCREAYHPTASELIFFSQQETIEIPNFYRGKGCEHCYFTGYRGRIPLVEYIHITAKLRHIILEGANHEQVFQAAKNTGYKTLRFDGFVKVIQGLTTMTEVLRMTSNADMDDV